MNRSHLTLAADGGKRVGRITKTAQRAAGTAGEAARLRRCLAAIREEAERSLACAEESEQLWEKAFSTSCGHDQILTRAMVREACISGAVSHRFENLIRACEMAEEGELCA